jgi:phosphoglycerate-specific signal transduction histidine kinase
MNNWTIAKRITLGFSALTLLTLIVGLIGYTSLRLLKEDTHTLLSDSMPGTIYLTRAQVHLAEEVGLLEQYVHSEDAVERAGIEKSIAELRSSNAELSKLYSAKIERDEDRAYFAKLSAPAEQLAKAREEVLSLAKGGNNALAYTRMRRTQACAQSLLRRSGKLMSI